MIHEPISLRPRYQQLFSYYGLYSKDNGVILSNMTRPKKVETLEKSASRFLYQVGIQIPDDLLYEIFSYSGNFITEISTRRLVFNDSSLVKALTLLRRNILKRKKRKKEMFNRLFYNGRHYGCTMISFDIECVYNILPSMTTYEIKY